MSIGGKIKENVEEIGKKVGIFPAKVLCINPNEQEYKDILGIELKEDSKATEYLGESKEGNSTLRVQIWLEHIKGGFRSPVTFFLEDKQKENKTEEGDGKVKKFQFINNVGVCSWAKDRNSLPDWFKKREHRIAFVGEQELYDFVRVWLGKLDFSDLDTTLQLEWKQVMKGNLKMLKEQIGGGYCAVTGALATIKTVEKDDGVKEYQSIWNKAFLPEYALAKLKLADYDSETVRTKLLEKEARSKTDKSVKLAAHEKFVLNAIGEYGVKEYFILKDLQDYDPSKNIASKEETLEPAVSDGKQADDFPF